MKKCPKCGITYENESVFCTNCGTPLIEEQPKKPINKNLIILIAVSALAVCFLVGFIVMTVNYQSDSKSNSQLVEDLNSQISSLQAETTGQTKTESALKQQVSSLNAVVSAQDEAESKLQQQISSLNEAISLQKGTIQSLESENSSLSSIVEAYTELEAKVVQYLRAPTETLKVNQNIFMVGVNKTIQIDVYWDSDETIYFRNFDTTTLDVSWEEEWKDNWTKLNVTGLKTGYYFLPIFDQNADKSVGENATVLLIIVQ